MTEVHSDMEIRITCTTDGDDVLLNEEYEERYQSFGCGTRGFKCSDLKLSGALASFHEMIANNWGAMPHICVFIEYGLAGSLPVPKT